MAALTKNATQAKMPPKLDDDAKSVRFNMIVPESWFEAIDEWRRKHPDLPNRSKAIRMLVDEALKLKKP